jgi:tetratricopeptide (TPR) repeat protein
MSDFLKRFSPLTVFCLLLAIAGTLYLPGISGPWIFDDYSNLLQNSYVKVGSLSAEELKLAAYSLQAGPLNRPVSMVSFALNYYFSGSFSDTTPYKLTNLIIHIINGLLVFWLSYLIINRLAQIYPKRINPQSYIKHHLGVILSGAISLFWVVHPIQITSVLYVVQRMTSLSVLFSLLSLICYLKVRLILLSGYSKKIWLLILGNIAFGIIGMLSKENAALIPVYISVLELILFSNEKPWTFWRRFSIRTKRLIYAGLTGGCVIGISWAIQYSLPGYVSRHFTLTERVMTEGRVLIFYLSLILVPRINQFGHLHDDIEISHSVTDPWTTLPSLIGICMLLVLAFVYRKKTPLFSLGIFWFFAGHLLESTILPLEIAHEHRNYLASLGVFFVIMELIQRVSRPYAIHKLAGLITGIALIFSGITYIRASQWSDYNTFYRYEVSHHPDSPRIQTGMSILLEAQGKQEAAIAAMRRAWELAPYDIGFLLSLHQLVSKQGQPLSSNEIDDTANRLETATLTPTAYLALENIASCLRTSCRSLQEPMEQWMNVILNERTDSVDRSYYYYLLGISLSGQGRIHEAIDVFRLSYESDPQYLHPLLNLAKIFIGLKQLDVAERVLAELHKANEKNLHPRDREIKELDTELEKFKKDTSDASGVNHFPAIPVPGNNNQKI